MRSFCPKAGCVMGGADAGAAVCAKTRSGRTRRRTSDGRVRCIFNRMQRMWRERQGGEKCQRGSGEVENRWKPSGNQTTTNRRSTKTSTTFCVFLLTEYFLPLILRIQIRGTWKRQTNRIGDETRYVWARPRGSPGSKRKNRARIPAPRPYFRRGTLLIGCVRTTGQR